MSAIYFEKNEIVINELDEFEQKIKGFKDGSYDPEEFKHRRLIQGIYGQRQPDMFMVRVKIPAGHLTPEMIDGLTEAAELYTNGVSHITTRQDIQLYYVNVDNLIPLLHKLADYGITTREASGATLRNVITSAFAGSLRGQAFDILPAIETVVRYFLRHPETQHLPRKFKVSFSENSDDLGVSSINDMGLIAKVENGRPGFKIMLGGSLGSTPVFGRVYKEFVPAEELLLNMLAILRAFNRYGDRAKRAEARLKFQFEKMGFDKFTGLVEKERNLILEEKVELPAFKAEITPEADFDFSNPFDKTVQPDRYMWFEKNVMPTVRENEYMVTVQVPNGDLSLDAFRALKNAHKNWNNGGAEFITLMDSQNLVLKGLKVEPEKKKEFFSEILKTLKSLGLDKPGVHCFGDVLTCMGSATCASGITHSPGMASALSGKLAKVVKDDDRFKGATVHISGCTNSCARHHVATLGFAGRADKTLAEGKEAPAYILFFGGAVLKDGQARLGRKVNNKLLAKRIPAFIDALVELFRKNAAEGQSFDDYLVNVNEAEISSLVNSFSVETKPIESDEMLHYDWGKDKPYVMEYGEGECS